MLWFPVKKIRKQFRLLLLLVLLTFAIWFTYLHISLVRQGKALRLHFGYGKDGERLGEGTDAGRRMSGAHTSSLQRKSEDSSESREEERMMNGQSTEGSSHHLNLTRKALPWSEKYKGLVNLHVFEDWCGGAVRQLRKNLHFPLYPHSRTTVKKLAVSPKWRNYGLRLFGYIHPFKDGDFQFAVSSDDNSEFWLSTDEIPANLRLVAYVGKMGTEWTAPGEFTKFSSQTSRPVRLLTSRRYYFELLHKQDDKGSDHVEVGWRIFLTSLKFEVIGTPYISLYTDEAKLRMDQVQHIPQTFASYAGSYRWPAQQEEQGIDMLKPDPRDTFFLTPLIDRSRVENVLLPCAYTPTYVVKDFPIARYQGLQFVYLSFVYPTDFTRLTHMETENKCFYRESPLYLEKFGFYKYMRMDEEDDDPHVFEFLDSERDYLDGEEEGVESREPTEAISQEDKGKRPTLKFNEFGDDADDYTFRQKKRKFAGGGTVYRWQQQTTKGPFEPEISARPKFDGFQSNQIATSFSPKPMVGRILLWVPSEDETLEIKKHDNLPQVPKLSRSVLLGNQLHNAIPTVINPKRQASNKSAMEKSNGKDSKKTPSKVYITRLHPGRRKTPRHDSGGFPGILLFPRTISRNRQSSRVAEQRASNTYRGKKQDRWLTSAAAARPLMKKNSAGERKASTRWNRISSPVEPRARAHVRIPTPEADLFSREQPVLTTTPVAGEELLDFNSSEVDLSDMAQVTSFIRLSEVTESQQEEENQTTKEEKVELVDYSYEDTDLQQNWLEDAINWKRTFSVSAMDFEMLRSDWNDLRCNVSGNLQLGEGEVVDVVAQYMEKLNAKNGGIYTLQNIVNVEKRRDSARGNRYLIELELLERGRKTVRLSEYVYVLLHHGKHEDSAEATQSEDDVTVTMTTPTESPQQESSPWSIPYVKPILCRPIRLSWSADVMVHFVIPVKNQARWVQQFITDMEVLYHDTRDENFNVIIADFDSEDIDVEHALRTANIPGYHYLKKTGNFERSAGLQAGVDSIRDNHSIIFLCDLHIHFPSSILDGIRKHCVEGKLAYAPIVMRLNCGSSPREPRGYWEVNGFGLFGIYKSDFDRIGGMNTEEFKDHWGGEDWELLDRVLQSGLEVERLRLRNFYHYFHSRRGMWNTRNKKTPPKA